MELAQRIVHAAATDAVRDRLDQPPSIEGKPRLRPIVSISNQTPPSTATNADTRH
jgi:hypothetical protein